MSFPHCYTHDLAEVFLDGITLSSTSTKYTILDLSWDSAFSSFTNVDSCLHEAIAKLCYVRIDSILLFRMFFIICNTRISVILGVSQNLVFSHLILFAWFSFLDLFTDMDSCSCRNTIKYMMNEVHSVMFALSFRNFLNSQSFRCNIL